MARGASAIDVPLYADLCSWLNAVEGFFSRLTRQSLKRGLFRSVDDLKKAITRYIAATKEPEALGLDSQGEGDQDQTRPDYPSEWVH